MCIFKFAFLKKNVQLNYCKIITTKSYSTLDFRINKNEIFLISTTKNKYIYFEFLLLFYNLQALYDRSDFFLHLDDLFQMNRYE